MRKSILLFAFLLPVLAQPVWGVADEPLNIKSRLEPFVDDFLIDRLTGDAKLQLHKPTMREVVLVADKPWEGNTSAYFTIFRDDECYRMYYRGWHFDEQTRKQAHRAVTCYAESKDGIHWTKPELGLFDWEGSSQNNIVWDGVGTHNFTPFKDANPSCPAEARYKAFGMAEGKDKHGLYAFQSADAIHWKLMRDEPVITKGAFDSQNLAFWDGYRGRYAEYHRGFRGGVRDIMTSTSEDFLHWTEPGFLDYPGAPKEHLYTNAIQPYDRAPHLLIGFPARFLPDRGQQVEPILMTSRDGRTFHRWSEPVIPVTALQDRDGNRSNYMAWGLVQLPGQHNECSVYATEAYYRGPAGRLRRGVYRVDGFASVHASVDGGTMLTKPFTFQGNRLVINYKGQIRVEIQDADGRPINGWRLADCSEMRGDAIAQAVAWKSGTDVRRFAGKPIRLLFELRDADLFSLRCTGDATGN